MGGVFGAKYLIKTKRLENGYNNILSLIIICVCIFLRFDNITSFCSFISSNDTMRRSLCIKTYPHDILSKCIYSIRETYLSTKDIEDARQHLNGITIDSCSFRTPKIVLILGESFNKHHSNLYGYRNQTNPKLNVRLNDNDLFIFKDVVTPYNSTSAALQEILSTETAEPGKSWKNKPLFPVILRTAGYNVFWIDNQLINSSKDRDPWNFLCAYFINDPQIEQKMIDYRNNSLHKYDMGVIDEWAKYSHQQSGHDFIFFHLWGQHVAAKSRFPHNKETLYFNADSIHRPNLNTAQKQQIADYDNSLRYNDSVVDSIISLFANEDAIVIYTSDHGDEVNDYRSHVGRSHERPLTKNQVKCQFEVPLMIWCSPIYKERHPETVSQIRKSTNNPFTIDDLCHLIFDLAGIKSPHFDESRSVINPKFIPRKRHLVQSDATYEDIMSK